MACDVEERIESFIVKINVGASDLHCTAYSNRPDLIIKCKWCESIPNVLYTSDKISQFCKSCFVRRLKYISGEGSAEKATHEILGFVTFNEALRDAAVKCPGCHRTGPYTELENHIVAQHPHLLNSGQQHPSSEVQLVNGVGPPPGFRSRQEAVHKRRYGNCPQSPPGTCGEETEKPGNTDSDTTQCMSPSISLDHDQTQEEAKRTVIMFLDCQKWFQTQLLKYYEQHLKDCYTPEEEIAKNIPEHVEKCPRVSSMQLNWFTKALSKYREHRNKQCSRCTESCSNFLEHAKHCEEFRMEVKTLCTDKMFEFYQQHANGCPGSIDANETPENTSSCEQTVPEKEADQDWKPVTTKPDKLPENLQGEQTVTQPLQHEGTTDESYLKQIEQLREEIFFLKEENKELQTTVQELESSQEKNCKAIAKLEEELSSASLQRLKFQELIAKQRKEFEAKWEEELKIATMHRLKFEELVEKQRSELQEAENCVRRLKTELHMDWLLPVFQHIWKLQPYSALRKSLLFNNATLSTGVLSVNTPGYKIELMISIKGDYREWRRQWLKDESSCSVPAPHLALMMRIHQGEDDNLLAWPFRNKIALLLVNHLDENKSKLLELSSEDADADCFNKPVRGALNAAFGFSRVISLPDVENLDRGFLFQDCIVFKFTVRRRE